MLLIKPHGDVGDVADPQLVDRRGNEVFRQVGEHGQSVRGIRCPGLPDALSQLKAALIQDI